MATPAVPNEPLYSEFASDPDLAELVDAFVCEMPLRCDLLRGHFRRERWPELQRAAHQMKGAAGSYGFDPLTPYAARLEAVVNQGANPSAIAQALAALLEQCQRVRNGSARRIL